VSAAFAVVSAAVVSAAAGATVAVVSAAGVSEVSPELHAAKKPATAKIANTFFIVLVFKFFLFGGKDNIQIVFCKFLTAFFTFF
jgi:hypothetical protein